MHEARIRGELGYVPQRPSLLPNRTVKENIRLPLELQRQTTSFVDETIELVGLQDVANRYPHQLSVGMQQRVSLARTLVYKPQIILMDEPFSSIDELSREKFQMDLLRIHRERKPTILFVTHSIEEAVYISQRIICMSISGNIIAERIVPLPYLRTMSTRSCKDFSQMTYDLRSILAL